jgi:sugar phosphate isomerase/epimerase
MKSPIGLQLYSVRVDLEYNFKGTIKQISSMGYNGIETAGFPEGTTPGEAKQLFDDLNLSVISSHSQLPLGDDKNKVLDSLAAIECPHLVSAWMNPDYYSSRDAMKELAEIFNQANSVARENGMKFSIHNHDFEFNLVDGIPAIYQLQDYLEPEINFQLDTYWIQVAGLDPVDVVTQMGSRAPLLHIKDGPATHEGDMTAVGDGVMDVPAIIQAGSPYTEWLIVELDSCATDMLEAVDKSYQYLVNLTD